MVCIIKHSLSALNGHTVIITALTTLQKRKSIDVFIRPSVFQVFAPYKLGLQFLS